MSLSSTSLSHLSLTNDPPTIEQASFARQAVTDMELEMAEYEGRMRELRRKLDEYRLILAPCRRLPPEILGEIFIHLMDGSPIGRQRVLVRVTRVCKSWRQAACMVPQLWKSAWVDLDLIGGQAWYPSVDSWLRRSGQLPKNLFIYNSPLSCSGRGIPHNPPSCKVCTVDVLSMLKFGPPLNELTINPGTAECWMNLMSNLQRQEADQTFALNSITSLTVWADDWPNWVDISHHPFPVSATSITYLELRLPSIDYRNDIFHVDAVDVGFPPTLLARLTYLYMSCNWPANHVYNMLQHCQSLETLNLDVENGDFGEWIQSNRLMHQLAQEGVNLPRLRTLRLNRIVPKAIQDLEFIRLSRIVDVAITIARFGPSPGEGVVTIDDGRGSALANFLRGDRNSKPTLQTLNIINGDFEGDTLVDVLQKLPSVEHLTLDHATFTSDMFTKIGATRTLPQLRTLKLLNLHVPLPELVGLHEFVQEREIELTTS